MKNTYFFLDDPFQRVAGQFSPPKVGSIDLYRSVRISGSQSPTRPRRGAPAYVDSIGDGFGDRVGTSNSRTAVLQTARAGHRLLLHSRRARPQDGHRDRARRGRSPRERFSPSPMSTRTGDTIGEFGKPAYSKVDTRAAPFELIWPRNPCRTVLRVHVVVHDATHLRPRSLQHRRIDARCRNPGLRRPADNLTTARGHPSVPWIRIFGLDRTDTRGTGKSDDKVDLLSGVIDLVRRAAHVSGVSGRSIPPADSVAAWTNGEFAFTGIVRGKARIRSSTPCGPTAPSSRACSKSSFKRAEHDTDLPDQRVQHHRRKRGREGRRSDAPAEPGLQDRLRDGRDRVHRRRAADRRPPTSPSTTSTSLSSARASSTLLGFNSIWTPVEELETGDDVALSSRRRARPPSPGSEKNRRKR